MLKGDERIMIKYLFRGNANRSGIRNDSRSFVPTPHENFVLNLFVYVQRKSYFISGLKQNVLFLF